MTKTTSLRSAASVIALLCATTANADVTAAEVWADWQENLSIYGEDGVTIGAETMDGDTLTISGITLKTDDGMTNVTAEMGDLMLTEQGDGTVAVTMAPSYPIIITNDDGDVIKINVTQSGLEMIVSGTAAEMEYAVSVDQYAFAVDEITEDGVAVKTDIRAIINDVAGTYTVKTDDMRHLTYAVTAASVDMIADYTPPETAGDSMTFSGKIEGLTADADMTMPLGEKMDAPIDMLTNGTTMLANYGYTGGNYIFEVKEDGEQTAGTASTGAGTFTMKMDATTLSYDSSVTALDVAMEGASLPFPIEVSMAEYGFGLDMPLSKTEEPTDFGLRMNLTDLAVNEMIWMMADPTNALPHDPATILLDLSGKAKLFFDLFDPEQIEAMEMTETPGELHALTVNDLRLKAAGVDVTGKGDFTFDNTDLVTFDGMPRPEGDLTINIKGANALIDSLVNAGFIPEDQANMSRMMMGMFAKVTGEDELTSTVEVNDQGHVMANGQRIQ